MDGRGRQGMNSRTPGSRLGRYEILDQIGQGGIASVFRARDPELGRDVALKVLPRYHSADPSFFARLRREAQAIAHLCHPNILQVYDLGEDRGFAYIVTRHVK